MKDDSGPFQFSQAVKQKLKNKTQLLAELAEGKLPQEILEMSQERMAHFYRVACFLFEQKHYENASHAFLFLATLDVHHPEYWLGVGMSTQLLHNYEAAIDAYELAALCDIASPIPYFYLAKCLFAIHDRDSALQALDLAIEIANDRLEFAELKQQAELARKVLLE